MKIRSIRKWEESLALPCVPGGVYKINWIFFLTVKIGDVVQVSGREAAGRTGDYDEGRTLWKLSGLFIFLAVPHPTLPPLFEFPCLSVSEGRQGDRWRRVSCLSLEQRVTQCTVRMRPSQVGAEACDCLWGPGQPGPACDRSQRPPPRPQLDSQEKEVNSLWTSISLLP